MATAITNRFPAASFKSVIGTFITAKYCSDAHSFFLDDSVPCWSLGSTLHRPLRD